jgi:transcriptional regulator with XRE-family HTH domain
MLSQTLKVLRGQRKITQEQLADILKMERSSVGKYESPNKPIMPSGEVLLRMSDYFGVSVDYLLGRKEYHNDRLTAEERELVKAFRNLKNDPKIKQAVLDIMADYAHARTVRMDVETKTCKHYKAGRDE